MPLKGKRNYIIPHMVKQILLGLSPKIYLVTIR